MVQGLRVLYLAAEATPLIKVGGLADVAGELPRALRGLGHDVLLTVPLHPPVDTAGVCILRSTRLQIPTSHGLLEATAHLGTLGGQEVLLIDGEPIRAAPGVYADAEANGRKFGFFSIAALEACRAMEWRTDVVHANDWHTGPAIYWLSEHRAADGFWRTAATILTVHNLGFMGAGSEAALSLMNLAPATDPLLPDWARSLPLPVALLTADWLTAVSPTYAREIRTPEFGFGLEALLEGRAGRLEGILNGIDPAGWEPSSDPVLPHRFSGEDLGRRALNREALRAEFELPLEPSIPLLAMVTRLDSQKGVDLALSALESLASERWQFILLGTGDPDLERRARVFADEHWTRARAVLHFDAALSRRIYGGADMLLVPSRYEPCGLAQLIAMRYGCIPVVRATGGLKDTVRDDSGSEGTGFTFRQASPNDLADAILRAVAAFADRRRWEALQRRAMATDYSWRRSAEDYAALYQRAVKARRAEFR